MQIYHLCSNCGAELFTKNITEEEATILSNEPLWKESQVYLSITPCLCTAGNKNAIVTAIKEALKQFEVR